MCDCGVDRESRMPMAAVVEGCGELGVGTPTQYVARWTEVAVVADRGLSMKAAVLLFATTMFCFTKDLVCTMTRAQLMAMTGIRTPASFAATVRELMGHSLLSPKDGAPRTSWYLQRGSSRRQLRAA